jgi:hypothetical protein
VRGAKREFLDAGIDQKRANLQGKGVSPLLCPGEPWNRVPLTESDDVWLGDRISRVGQTADEHSASAIGIRD